MKNATYFLVHLYLFILAFSVLVMFDQIDALENQVAELQTKIERIK